MMFLPKIFLDEDQIEKIYSLEKEGNINKKAVSSIYILIFAPITIGVIILFFLISCGQILAAVMLIICLCMTIYFHTKNRFENLFIPYTFGRKTSGTIDSAKYKFSTLRSPRELYIYYSYIDENDKINTKYLTLSSTNFIKLHNIKAGQKITVYIDEKSNNTAPYYEDLFLQFCLDKTRILSVKGD